MTGRERYWLRRKKWRLSHGNFMVEYKDMIVLTDAIGECMFDDDDGEEWKR